MTENISAHLLVESLDRYFLDCSIILVYIKKKEHHFKTNSFVVQLKILIIPTN